MLAGLACCGAAMAQDDGGGQQRFWTVAGYTAYSVNNDGQAVVSSFNWNEPYNIWTPETGEVKEIGGVSAGNNVGGIGAFSEDGKRVSASVYSDRIKVSTAWEKTVLEGYDYSFKDIQRVPDGTNIFVIGCSGDGTAGYMLRNTNNGKTWKASSISVNGDGESSNNGWRGGLECMAWQSWAAGFVGGGNGCFYYSSNAGGEWTEVDPHPAGNTDEVKTYRAMHFIPSAEPYGNAVYGALGLEKADGTGTVWYTDDAMESMKEATGVSGVPVSITNAGETYFMATANGVIQKSEDYGATLVDVYNIASPAPWAEGSAPLLNRIRFADELNGMALGTGFVLVTTDGGKTWTQRTVADGTGEVTWNDVAFLNGKATLVGSEGNMYETADMGATWTKLTVESGQATGLLGIYMDDKCSVVSADGAMFYQSPAEYVEGYTAGWYDMEAGEWHALPGTGYFSGETASSGWDISGDGTTLVGGVYNYEQFDATSAIRCDAAAWVDGELKILPNKFADISRSAQARGVSYDGSVIVGWQDHHGPWYASVWRRNADGGYDQSLMPKDPNLTEDDVDMSDTSEGRLDMNAKLLGEAEAVSADGKIIGGKGNSQQFATDCAWIWSEEKGLKELGGTSNMVFDMTNDGSMVVTNTEVWTEETGLVGVNEYLTKYLGIDLGEFSIVGIYDISPNGRYMTGYCMSGMGKYCYVVDLKGDGSTGIDNNIEQTKAAVYPNPVAGELHVDLPFGGMATRISLYSTAGAMVKSMNTTSTTNVINVSDLAEGVYILEVSAGGARKTFKLIVRH